MLNLLNLREKGIDRPDALSRAERTRRAACVELSKYQDFEAVHKAGVTSLDLDQTDNRYLLSGASDGTIAIHDTHITTGKPQCTYPKIALVGLKNKHRHKYSVETVQWYPLDTGMFISSGMDKLLKVWDTNNLLVADEYQLSGLIYSHDISTVASHCLIAVASRSSQVRLIDIKCGAATHSLRGHKKSVLSVKWSPTNEYLLASGSEDNRVYLWDVRSAKGHMMALDQYNGDTFSEPNAEHTAHNGFVNGLCFTSNGLHLVTFGTDQRLHSWEVNTGKNTMINYGNIDNDSHKKVTMAVSQYCNPDFVYVPADYNIEVFQLLTGTHVETLRGHYSQVNCVITNPESQELYSGGNDRTLLFWVPETEHILAYEAHVKQEAYAKLKQDIRTTFVQRIGTGDTWSSDED